MKPIDWMKQRFARRPPATRKPLHTRDLDQLAEQVRIEHPSGKTGMSLRPSGTDSDVAREFGHYSGEQLRKHDADGLRESRPAAEQAASLKFQAGAAKRQALSNERRLADMQEQHDHAHRWLQSFTHRPLGAHRLYVVWFVLLGLGDAAGVFGATVLWGEVIPTAIGQALAVGAAAVAAGWVGGDVRERRDAKSRAGLAATGKVKPKVIKRYPALFAPVPPERDTYGVLLAVAVVIVVCLGAAIFALRAAVETSLLAGLIFGGLSVATALASFVNTWRHADQVADLLDRIDARYEAAMAEQLSLSAAAPITRRAAAKQRALQIRAYHEALGNAASEHVLALKHGVHRRNAAVFGHGIAKSRVVEVTGTPVGRRALHPVAEANGREFDSSDLQHVDNFPPFDFENWTSPGDPPF